MTRFLRMTAILALGWGVAGCDGLGTKSFNKFNIADGNSISIDATQRVILVAPGQKDGKTYVCAEPSPDAITALAAQLALKGSAPQGPAGELAASFLQSAASIGLRTQTIQILRDLLYRACEARINQLVEKAHLKTILCGIDDLTLGIVAIDGLTQGRPAPLVAISGVGEAKTTKDGAEASSTGATVTIHDVTGGAKSEELSKVATQVKEIVKIVIEAPPCMQAAGTESG